MLASWHLIIGGKYCLLFSKKLIRKPPLVPRSYKALSFRPLCLQSPLVQNPNALFVSCCCASSTALFFNGTAKGGEQGARSLRTEDLPGRRWDEPRWGEGAGGGAGGRGHRGEGRELQPRGLALNWQRQDQRRLLLRFLFPLRYRSFSFSDPQALFGPLISFFAEEKSETKYINGFGSLVAVSCLILSFFSFFV